MWQMLIVPIILLLLYCAIILFNEIKYSIESLKKLPFSDPTHPPVVLLTYYRDGL